MAENHNNAFNAYTRRTLGSYSYTTPNHENCGSSIMIPNNPRFRHFQHELANSQEALLVDAADSSNIKLVRAFYDALSARDSHAVLNLVAPDLEWWFHGPPSCQFLKRLLTGESSSSASTAAGSFEFVPLSVVSFGSTVIAEGRDAVRSVAWVHAWTVTDGIITQVREYFNTSLTVTKIGDSDSDSDSGESEIVPASSDSGGFPCVWESSVSGFTGKSVPGLVLAI
ncbi:uncharacterized protein LOC107469313 [Arachis duranensis]|uniref:Uncharacterized protein LOC107469313 n=1 Tax=Arachis duranensis TaxID=130453 RepID=A0A6P4BLH9_ARADU|nr:uncharacterized protein LOC107469313 [Arachis duranensis]